MFPATDATVDILIATIEGVAAIKVVDGGEGVSERKRAFGGGQNSTPEKAVSEQHRGKSASCLYNGSNQFGF